MDPSQEECIYGSMKHYKRWMVELIIKPWHRSMPRSGRNAE